MRTTAESRDHIKEVAYRSIFPHRLIEWLVADVEEVLAENEKLREALTWCRAWIEGGYEINHTPYDETEDKLREVDALLSSDSPS